MAKNYGMLIDLKRCVGCNSCAVACKIENETPGNRFNTWVDSWDVSVAGRIARANVPKQCNHCKNAPCISVCPTGASYRDENGLVLVDTDRCIGCKYCMAACPYQVRWQNDVGEVEKCTFCNHRVEAGLLPACVTNCITLARTFGDLDDPTSEISKKIAAAGKVDVYMKEFGLEPKVFYIGLDDTLALPRVSSVTRGGNVLKKYEEVQ